MCSIQQDTAHQLRRSGASTLLFSFVILIQAMNLLHGTASKNPPRSPHEHYIGAELITTKQQLNQSFQVRLIDQVRWIFDSRLRFCFKWQGMIRLLFTGESQQECHPLQPTRIATAWQHHQERVI